MKKIVLKKWMYDFILSIVMLVLIAVALVYSYILESPRVDLFLARPDTYMALWLIVLGILALMLLRRSLAARKTEEGQQPGTAIWCGLGVFTAIALLVYLLVLKYLGFFLDSAILMWVYSLVYTFRIGAVKKDWRNRRVFLAELVKTGIFAIASSGATYLVFIYILSAKLPTFSLC